MIIVNLYIDGGSYVYTHKKCSYLRSCRYSCQDLLLAGRKIVHMAPSIGELPFDCTVIDVSGAKVTTGFIDQHIHITGGGGEGSFATRVPEIQLSQLTTAGTTTVIGCLALTA